MQKYSEEKLLLSISEVIDETLPSLQDILLNMKTLEVLGEGQFGKVVKYTSQVNKISYAVKIMPKRKIIQSNQAKAIKREVETMYKCSHKNIIKIYNHYEDDSDVYLLMEIAQGGSLRERINEKRRLDEKTVRNYVFQIISAVQYLHSKNIIHRDIKTENVIIQVINGIELLKLCDFGCTNIMTENLRVTQAGTPVYYAPEMILSLGHDLSVDVWCIGILTYELLTGFTPFEFRNKSLDFNQIKKNILRCKFDFPSDFPTIAKVFVNKILVKNPKQRMTCGEMLNHVWLKSLKDHTEEIKPSQSILPNQPIQINNLIKYQIPQEETIESLKSKIEDFQVKNKLLTSQLSELASKKGKLKEKLKQYDNNNLLMQEKQEGKTTIKFDLNHWKMKQTKLKEEYEYQCKMLRNKEILINEQEHEISKRDSLQRQVKQTQKDNKAKEELINKLKYTVHKTEFTLKTQELEKQEKEQIYKAKITQLTQQLHDITEKDDLPQLLQSFYDETQKEITFIEGKMSSNEENQEKISAKQKTINKLKEEMEVKREELNNQVENNITLVKEFGERMDNIRNEHYEELSKVKNEHDKIMKELNKEASRLIKASSEKNKANLQESNYPTEVDLEELQIQLDIQTQQLEQEQRLKENYNQENIWLKFLNESINLDIHQYEKELKTCSEKCKKYKAEIDQLVKKLKK